MSLSSPAVHLTDHVLPQVPHRQWVFTLPYRLRFLLSRNPRLLTRILQTCIRALFVVASKRAKAAGLKARPTGAITFIQRFGSALQLNVHFHVVMPDGTRAYVANNSDGTVSVIDTATNTVTATYSVGFNSVTTVACIAISPDGTPAWVVENSYGTVSVIDTATNSGTGTIPVGSGPVEIAISADGTPAWVLNYDYGTVSVIDTATNSVTGTISVGLSPSGIAISPDGTRAWVSNMKAAAS